jgi:hypothetical protein
MSRKVSTILISVALVALLLMISLTNGILHPASAPKIVEVKTVLILSDKEKIDMFIDEMMTKQQGSCLKQILIKESNMRSNALNKSSKAKGVGQLLDSTYRNLGLKHSADPLAQVVATIAYVGRHYGGSNAFCTAWTFHTTTTK